MGKHILFLIHGMGGTQPGWSQEIQQLIRERYDEYPKLRRLVPFDDNFTFSEINYNGLFDERRSAWKHNAQAVLATLAHNGLDGDAVNLLMGYAAETGRDAFLTTHVLDVILYRFIPQLAEQVRTSVERQILATLTTQPEHDTLEWSIIAHSLGTAVAHDTLHAMYSGSGALPASITRPQVVAMLANVSRILATDSDVYRSGVAPCIEAGKGVCGYFLNARHAWDPIPVPRQFRPAADWPDAATAREQRFQDLLIDAIEQKNVHDFAHYLKNPRVHIALFRALTWRDTIDQQSADQACARYDAGHPLAQFDALVDKLKQLRPGDEASWREVIACFRQFQELIRSDL